MELGTPEALQLLLLACTVAASYGVARSQIKRLLDDLASTAKEVENQGRRLDRIEQHQKVGEHQIAVLANILSPDSLKQSNREMANVIARIDILERQCASLASMHNGEHKYIAPPPNK